MFELAECKFELTSTWNGSIFSCYYMCVWYLFVQRFQSKCTVVWYTVIVLQTVSSTKTDSKSHVCNCESLKFRSSHFPLKKSLKVDISWHYPVIPIPVFLSFVIKCVFIATIAVICSADLQQESEASISASTRAEQWIIVTIIYLFYHFIRFSLNRKLFLCT